MGTGNLSAWPRERVTVPLLRQPRWIQPLLITTFHTSSLMLNWTWPQQEMTTETRLQVRSVGTACTACCSRGLARSNEHPAPS